MTNHKVLTEINTLASEYAGAAGSNHGLTSWDELWGYVFESSVRLWEELTPVSTRKNSIRFITTYAGWENESKLLLDLYRLGVSEEEHPESQGERIHPELPIYANRDACLFIYWDREPRIPWKTPLYYETQERTLRAATYLRLLKNRWATAESAFVTPELWDPCVDPSLSPPLPTRDQPIFVGVDAAIKNDTAAVVAVRREQDNIALVSHRIWHPTPGQPLDLESTSEAHLSALHEQFYVHDPLRSISTSSGDHDSEIPRAQNP